MEEAFKVGALLSGYAKEIEESGIRETMYFAWKLDKDRRECLYHVFSAACCAFGLQAPPMCLSPTTGNDEVYHDIIHVKAPFVISMLIEQYVREIYVK
jgi:hypothetical protein